jgi:hypothetical protein
MDVITQSFNGPLFSMCVCLRTRVRASLMMNEGIRMQ